MGHSVLWDILRMGRFKSWTFSDGTFLEWDVSRAGPFVSAPEDILCAVTLTAELVVH